MTSGFPCRISQFSSRLAAMLLLIPGSQLLAQQNRLPESVDAARRVMLRGSASPRAEVQLDCGPVEPATRLRSLSLMLNGTPAQQAALDRLLAEQQDPESPNFLRWLTPEEFADRFSLSQSDYDRVAEWLTSSGFTVDYAGRGRNWILFSGTAGQVENVFQTRMRRYLIDGEMRYANDSEPSSPEAIAPLVGWLSLNDIPITPRSPANRSCQHA